MRCPSPLDLCLRSGLRIADNHHLHGHVPLLEGCARAVNGELPDHSLTKIRRMGRAQRNPSFGCLRVAEGFRCATQPTVGVSLCCSLCSATAYEGKSETDSIPSTRPACGRNGPDSNA